MRVEELIAELTLMDPAGRQQVSAALDKVERGTSEGPPAPDAYLRGLAALQELMDGVCDAPGQCLSEDIDAVVYGDEAVFGDSPDR